MLPHTTTMYIVQIHIQNSCFLLPCQTFPPFPYFKNLCFIGRKGQSLFWTSCTPQFFVHPCRFHVKLSPMELGIFMLLKGAKSDNTLLQIKTKEIKFIHVNKLLVHSFVLKSSKFIISMQTFFPLDILQKKTSFVDLPSKFKSSII